MAPGVSRKRLQILIKFIKKGIYDGCSEDEEWDIKYSAQCGDSVAKTDIFSFATMDIILKLLDDTAVCKYF